jgi:hypothetical protein
MLIVAACATHQEDVYNSGYGHLRPLPAGLKPIPEQVNALKGPSSHFGCTDVL